jgi:hypothetical protein
MIGYEALMSGLIKFGRESVHDFIVRSNDVNDAATYLWVDLSFNLARVLSFETTDLVTFEKKEVLRDTLNQAKNQGLQ